MALEKLVAAGELDSFRSLHSFLWSADLQRRNRAQLAASPDLADRLLVELAEQGFRREAFSAFSDSLTGEPEPLRLGDLLGSPIAPWISPFVLPADEGSDDTASRVALVTLVRGVDDPAALLDTLAPIDGVVYLDQLALLEAGYGELRRAALRFVGLGAGLVLVLLWLHYRSLAATAIALLPALLACGTTAGLISLAGLPLNLVNLFGLLLILGMGVDYGVFLAESARQREPVGATAVGLLLSCTTSVLGLGLLSLSSNPGLRSLGVTTAVGVISSLLLGPAVLAVLGRRELEPTT
jgi:predicted exporter